MSYRYAFNDFYGTTEEAARKIYACDSGGPDTSLTQNATVEYFAEANSATDARNIVEALNSALGFIDQGR